MRRGAFAEQIVLACDRSRAQCVRSRAQATRDERDEDDVTIRRAQWQSVHCPLGTFLS